MFEYAQSALNVLFCSRGITHNQSWSIKQNISSPSNEKKNSLANGILPCKLFKTLPHFLVHGKFDYLGVDSVFFKKARDIHVGKVIFLHRK